MLKHQYLEYQDHIVRRASALAGITVFIKGAEQFPEGFPL